jgi:glycosyltransferase involved in cell wall biosynthesis
MAHDELIVLPGVRASYGKNGGFVLTQKYLEGVGKLAKFWPGPVTSLVEITNNQSTDFDHVEADPHILETGLEARPDSMPALMARLEKAAVVLGFLARRDAVLAGPCREKGLPLVYVIEYSPQTEIQIMQAGTTNPLVRLRRRFWLERTDRIRRAAARLSAGLQCSGTPTYDFYADYQPNRLLFFDNRLEADEVLSDAACRAKVAELSSGRPLRLVYGGRFVPMKGVMDLPEVALALKQAGIPFTMDIYGDGPQKAALGQKIAMLGLAESVRIQAPLDFRTGWVKVLKEYADIFVCCHPQGDPSSTYPEVMSCGVPIVGYDNEAFRGVVAESGCGWPVPIGQAGVLADAIAKLDSNRPALADAALQGLLFGRRTVFEATFKARAEHLILAARA